MDPIAARYDLVCGGLDDSFLYLPTMWLMNQCMDMHHPGNHSSREIVWKGEVVMLNHLLIPGISLNAEKKRSDLTRTILAKLVVKVFVEMDG
jgi:hypothetical protein